MGIDLRVNAHLLSNSMANKKPTSGEIKKQIEWLQTNKRNIPSYSGFGDSHWDAIDAIIEVLEEDFTEDDIYDRSCDDGEDPEEMGVEWSFGQREAALTARRWLDGEGMAPQDDYKDLVRKNK